MTSWYDYPAAITGRTERSLLNWFGENVKRGETWIDIGAHYGYTAIALSMLVGPSGRVFAFEPVLSTAGYLAQTRFFNRFPQLTVLPLALGAADAFDLIQRPTVRGMVDSTLEGTTVDQRSLDWRETVLMARMDWLWPQICGGQENIHGVKIDVQGMELEVLSGMVELLRRFRPELVVEFHSGVDRFSLLKLIESLGYSPLAVPIEPAEGEIEAKFQDDRSYAFRKI